MAESVIFVLIGALVVSLIIVIFGWHQWVDPRWVVFAFFALLIPGLWGAFTTGPFVPSGKKKRKIMLKLANLQPTDVVYELGFGDGSLIFAAAKTVKRAVGYEISIPLVCWGKLVKWLTRSKAEMYFGNIWKQDYRDADILFCYLMPNAMARIYKEIWPTLRPGTRVVTHSFRIHGKEPTAEEDYVYVYQV
ncbi:MAG: hypothetical protein V1908_02885 [Candidatus Peregrinibacteria bacterium]